MTSVLKCVLASAALLSFAGISQAELYARGGGMVYDSTQNITWLSDWNYAVTTDYKAPGYFGYPGRMSLEAAEHWAASLSVGGFHDWRLPTSNVGPSSGCSTTLDPGHGLSLRYEGFNCVGSQIGHLFYVDFGGSAGASILAGSNKANIQLFSDVQFPYYWTSTRLDGNPASAWRFYTSTGYQTIDFTDNALHAVAVRDGDVSAVPQAGSLMLMLGGIGLFIGLGIGRTVNS